MEERSDDSPSEIGEFLKSIFKVDILNSLEKFELKIKHKDTRKTIEIYPFNTMQDLKVAIYEIFDKSPYAAPNNQLLFYVKPSEQIEIIDFLWDLESTNMPTPGGNLSQFVNSSGDKQTILLNIYNNYLLENRLRKSSSIHVLFYKDLMDMFSSLPQPLSEKEYNGRIYPYFPFLRREEYPNEKDKENIEMRLEYFQKRNEFIDQVQHLLTRDLALIPPIFAGFKYLKLSWYEQDIREGIKTLFFELNVNDRRPYLRLLPTGSSAISKIHLKDIDKKIPNITDIRLMKGWADEKSPTPERDFVLGKIALPYTISNIEKLYSSIRLFDDGSFDLIIEPPKMHTKDIRKIDPFNDFNDGINGFISCIEEGIGSISREKNIPYLSHGNFNYSITIPRSYIRITRKIIKKRLALFSPFFQEIPSLPNEQPMIMLRYKCVNNFKTEDNISNFLTQLINKNILRGPSIPDDMIKLVSEEFQIDYDQALEKVSNWFKKRKEVHEQIVDEKKEYTPLNNTGIDIAIFENHPSYSFYYTNIDSVKSLNIVNTLFSLMFSLENESFSVSQRDVTTLSRVEDNIDKSDEVSEGDDDNRSVQSLGLDLPSEESDTEESPQEQLRQAASRPIEDMKDVPRVIEERESETQEKVEANYFLNKLKAHDRKLFEYDTAKGNIPYASQCAVNESRQPASLSSTKYQEMIEEYSEDGDVDFVVYPLKQGEKDTVSKTTDPDTTITVLRYGSQLGKENYYVCSKFFCTKDYIVVLKKDFEGTKLRHPITTEDGRKITDKPKDTCPFCMGKLITNYMKPIAGETVIQRHIKPNSKKRPLWIGYLSKVYHPDGLRLPCCFVKPSSIKYKDTDAKGIKKITGEEDNQDGEDGEDGESDYDEKSQNGGPIIEYVSTLGNIKKKYIIGEEKMPLEIRDGPQIGLIPKELDPLFEQDSNKLVSNIGTSKKLMTNVKGFLRVGVDNRVNVLPDSFLAALAPFFTRNSAEKMKERILEVLHPRVFVQMNYGNLVLEFYNPKIIFYKNINKVKTWAHDNLGLEYNDKNSLEILRIHNSYNNFIIWLRNNSTKKEYRQFSMIIAQANLIQGRPGRPGMTIIAVDIHKDNSVSLRCPTYGYNAELMDNNDVVFMMHHYSGIWEPLFYVDTMEVEDIRDKDLFTLVFQKGRYNGWPEIVKKLYGEFRRSCSGPGKTIYTSQSHINSNALLSLSSAKRLLLNISAKHNNFTFEALLRDAYNHTVAIICEETTDDKRSYQILLPVVDDGILLTDKSLILNWNNFNGSPVDETMRIYKTYLLPYIGTRYPGYAIHKYVVSNSTEEIIGIQLKNLLFIPVEETENTITDNNSILKVDEFEWDINREIILKNNEYNEVESKMLKEDDLEEIYQHLRVSFGNYLTGPSGSVIKKRIEEDILSKMKKLTLHERRRRMFILFGTEIISWFSTEKNKETTFSFIRSDCRIQTQDTCQGNCVWTSDNKCKLHIPDNNEINIGKMLVARLIDEILRFAEKRRELFQNNITKLVFFKKPIRIGDQYIIPENTLEWSDMLRVIWSDTMFEKPRFFEEISNEKDIKTKKEVEQRSEVYQQLSGDLKSYLDPEDLKTNSLFYFEITKEPSVLPILNTLGYSTESLEIEDTTLLLDDKTIDKLRRLRKASFIQLNLTTSPVQVTYSKVSGNKYRVFPVYVIIIANTSSGLLVKSKDSESLQFTDLPDTLENILTQ